MTVTNTVTAYSQIGADEAIAKRRIVPTPHRFIPLPTMKLISDKDRFSSKTMTVPICTEDLFVTLVYNCFWKLTRTISAKSETVAYLRHPIDNTGDNFQPQSVVQALKSAIRVPVSCGNEKQQIYEKLSDLILHFKDHNFRKKIFLELKFLLEL